MRLANITWPQAQAYFKENDMVLIGIGSIECHGRHMPLGTDTLIPDHLLEMIEEKSDVLIAPTIPYGACQSLSPYPGTIDIDGDILYQFFRQIMLSLYRHGARKFVILNGHGGNMKTIERLGLEFEDKGCLVAMLNWWLMAWDMNPAWKGGHGGADAGIVPSFVDFVLTGAKPDVSPVDARNAVAAGCMGHYSMRHGSIPCDIPPVPEHLRKYFDGGQAG